MEPGPLQYQIDGLMQERGNSIANALELRLSGTNPLKYSHKDEKNLHLNALIIACIYLVFISDKSVLWFL